MELEPVRVWSMRKGRRYEVGCWGGGLIGKVWRPNAARRLMRRHRWECLRDRRAWPDNSLVKRWHGR